MGLFASLVLSAFPNPTIAFVTPDTVPVKVGLFMGARVTRVLLIVVIVGDVRAPENAPVVAETDPIKDTFPVFSRVISSVFVVALV